MLDDHPMFMSNSTLDDKIEYIRQMIPSVARAKVRKFRQVGLPDADVRDAVLRFAINRTAAFGALGFNEEYTREKYASWVQNSVEEALATPYVDDLNEADRRLPGWMPGVPFNLANGEIWWLPTLTVAKEPRQLNDGTIDMQYPWCQREGGAQILTEIIRIQQDKSPYNMLPCARRLITILLQWNYRVTDVECIRLAPVDFYDPSSFGEVVGKLDEDSTPEDAVKAFMTVETLSPLSRIVVPVAQDFGL